MLLNRHPRSIGAMVAMAVGTWLVAAPATADLDVVFVLDTTGSMGGEIREVQQRVHQLTEALAKAYDGQRLRYGFVAYRDRGDDYVTRHFDLSQNVNEAKRFLDSLSAGGGGDGPESVVAAISVALGTLSWDLTDGVDRQLFLIGDAPPHLDYGDEPTPDQLIDEARELRIVINAIGCRSLPSSGVRFFRTLAYGTEGSYQHIGRVEVGRAGALTDALERSATAAAPATVGSELGVTWLDKRENSTSGILVRHGGREGLAQSRDADELDPCSLEVRLPPGSGLETPPRVWLGDERLRVELALIDGPGGAELFGLSECPAADTPIDVVLGAPPAGGR
jgi:uncharacterized protein YegL